MKPYTFLEAHKPIRDGKLFLIMLITVVGFWFFIVWFGVTVWSDNEQNIGGSFIEEKNKIQDNLKIKATNNLDVLYSSIVNGEINYVYKSDVKFPKQKGYLEKGWLVKEKTSKDLLGALDDGIDENLSKRTHNSNSFDLTATTTITNTYSGAMFYYDNPEWYVVEYSTTTIDAYNIQMDASFSTSTEIGYSVWKNIFSKEAIRFLLVAEPVLATTFGPRYSGTGDGWVRFSSAATTFTAARTALTGTASGYTGQNYTVQTTKKNTTNFEIDWMTFPFDTSAIPDTDTIDSGFFSFYTNAVSGADASINLDLIKSIIISDTVVANADYDLRGETGIADAVRYASTLNISSAGRKSMTLNASGLANIDKTGFSKFALTDKKDVDNTEPSNQTYIFIYCVEQTGTTKDPYIQLVHSAGAVTAPAQFRNQSIIIND